MKQNFDIDFSIHYYLNDKNSHIMDAVAHNKCEKQLLNAFQQIRNYTGEDFRIDVSAKKEGGLIDYFQLVGGSAIVSVLIQKVLDYFFNPNKDFLVDTQNRLDIINKIKENNLTDEEAELIVSGDSKLEQYVSNFYKSAMNSGTVSSIESTIVNKNKVHETSQTALIDSKQFDKKIKFTSVEKSEKVIRGTDIRIISPVIIPGYPKLWEGVYSGEKIVFKIEDKNFLDQVYNRDVTFESGTLIKCDLLIKETNKRYKGQIKTDKKYHVVLVRSWSDGKTYQTETKRYKALLKEEREL